MFGFQIQRFRVSVLVVLGAFEPGAGWAADGADVKVVVNADDPDDDGFAEGAVGAVGLDQELFGVSDGVEVGGGPGWHE